MPVLILVLMEDGRWQAKEVCKVKPHHVLILVLMEYGLWLVMDASRNMMDIDAS